MRRRIRRSYWKHSILCSTSATMRLQSGSGLPTIQRSAHIEPGRDGLFNLIKAAPPSFKYEPGVILAEDDYVIVHGRFSNIGLPVNWIAADVVRLKDGILVEHWDVIQDEATEQQSKSGNPMFGDSFPK